MKENNYDEISTRADGEPINDVLIHLEVLRVLQSIESSLKDLVLITQTHDARFQELDSRVASIDSVLKRTNDVTEALESNLGAEGPVNDIMKSIDWKLYVMYDRDYQDHAEVITKRLEKEEQERLAKENDDNEEE